MSVSCQNLNQSISELPCGIEGRTERQDRRTEGHFSIELEIDSLNFSKHTWGFGRRQYNVLK